jgi:DNA modification methylase
MRNIKDRKLEVVNRRVEDLIPYARNARTHTDAQVAQIAASIVEFGWTNPVLTDGQNGIIAGHGRVLAARKLGLAEVPTLSLEGLTKSQVRAYVLADNKLALNAGWDVDALKIELGELKAEGFNLDLTGFSTDEIAESLAEATQEGETDPDDVPEVLATPVSKLGDLWLMGSHRLLCGDSTVQTDVDRVMEGSKVDLIFTDPPYGVAYVGGVSHAKEYASKRETNGLRIENDSISSDELVELLRSAFGCAYAVCKKGACWFVTAPAGPLFLPFAIVLNELGVWKQTLVWLKSALVFGRSDYHYRHESIFYGWVPGGAHCAVQDRTQDTIWEFPRPKGSENPGHPTPKPVELIELAIGNHTSVGALIFDGFAGSGSVAIAAEKLGRISALIELEPKYCDVIIKRWQAFTGKQATLESTGRTFEEESAKA